MEKSTQRKMASGAAWMVLFKLVERSLGLISTLILVRLLDPKDFGIVAMAMSFIVMAELLTSFGFDTALIQNQRAAPHLYHTAWTCNVMFGLLVFVLMVLAAAPAALFYAEPGLFWVLCFLALGPLISGLENIGIIAFRKELRFRSEFVFQISRKLAGFLVVVPLAFWLKSYWALVAGMLASKLAGTIISYFAHPFRPRFSLTGARGLFSFSKWLLLINAMAFLKGRLTDFFIGRQHGATALGLYNVSFEIANLPTSELGAPINRALFPGFSQLAADAAPIRAAYANALGVLAMFALPAAAGIFSIADFLVPVVLGSKWLAAVPVIQILGIFGAFELFHSSMCTLLVATGHPGEVAKGHGVFVLVLLVLLVLLVAPRGVSGAALAAVGASVISTAAYLFSVQRCLGIGPMIFARAAYRPLLAAVAMAFVLGAAMPHHHAAMTASDVIFLLILKIAVGAVLYLLFLGFLWLISGRPASAERMVYDRLREFVAGRKESARS